MVVSDNRGPVTQAIHSTGSEWLNRIQTRVNYKIRLKYSLKNHPVASNPTPETTKTWCIRFLLVMLLDSRDRYENIAPVNDPFFDPAVAFSMLPWMHVYLM